MPDTGAQSPTATGDDYTDYNNPTNAYSSDDSYTDAASPNDEQDWYDFGFSIPAGSTIDGIRVDVEMHAWDEGRTCTQDLELSWDGGGNYTSTGYDVTTTSASDVTETAGGASNTWGRTWAVSEFSNANFRIKCQATGQKSYVDHIQITVYYTEAVGFPPIPGRVHRERRSPLVRM